MTSSPAGVSLPDTLCQYLGICISKAATQLPAQGNFVNRQTHVLDDPQQARSESQDTASLLPSKSTPAGHRAPQKQASQGNDLQLSCENIPRPPDMFTSGTNNPSETPMPQPASSPPSHPPSSQHQKLEQSPSVESILCCTPASPVSFPTKLEECYLPLLGFLECVVACRSVRGRTAMAALHLHARFLQAVRAHGCAVPQSVLPGLLKSHRFPTCLV